MFTVRQPTMVLRCGANLQWSVLQRFQWSVLQRISVLIQKAHLLLDYLHHPGLQFVATVLQLLHLLQHLYNVMAGTAEILWVMPILGLCSVP